MNTDVTTGEYMLLFRGPLWHKGLSSDELQQVMNKVMAWFEDLRQRGKMKVGQPLGAQGRLISAKKNGVIADGPFVESKEAVGGYLLLEAEDLNEPIKIARSIPTLKYGVTVEVRPILAECPVLRSNPDIVKRAREQLWTVAAA
jgi:hypothetical protein